LESLETIRANRILIVVTTLAIGGAETQVVRLASELKARGWDISIVCLVKPVAYEQQLRRQLIPVYSLDMKFGVPDFRAIFRLRSLIRHIRPDVVHCHMFHANLLGRITRLFCKMPALICTAQNTREASRRSGLTWHKELLYRATDHLADWTTIICQAGFDRYVRLGAVPRKKLRLIPNGIDTKLFSCSDEQRQSARHALGIGSEFVWLAVGRLVKQKEYPNLLRAIERLGRDDFVVLIAGEGPLQQQLQEECIQLGLSEQVRFCGAREDILDLYQAADAFVMSSGYEGLSVALLEAASMGLPAVVTNVGGNPEIVVDNVTGYLVSPGNPPELAAAMRRLMEATPEHRSAMNCAARQHCLRHYRIAAVIDQWVDLYAGYLPAEQLSRAA
jgi:glycosyltransferase involved in cell wall biosynthesis